jgi:hypothetical protein
MFAAHKHLETPFEQQVKILVHEISHYLGLFHTKDSGYMFIGDVYDQFEDTPREVTGQNMMDPGIHTKTPTFSPSQIQFLKKSPILR